MKPRSRKMKVLLCRLFGHDLRPITDYLSTVERIAAMERFQSSGQIKWSRCARCGYER